MVVHSADVSAEGERVRASAGRLIERVREIGTPCSDHETPFILVWLEWAGYEGDGMWVCVLRSISLWRYNRGHTRGNIWVSCR